MYLLKKGYISLMLVFFCSSFYLFLGITPVKLAFLLLFLILSFYLYKNYNKVLIADKKLTILFSVFIFSATISILYAANKQLSLTNLMSLYYAYFLFLGLSIFIRFRESNYSIIVNGLIVAGIVNGFFSLLQVATGSFFMPGTPDRSISTEGLNRANGLYDDPNYLGLFLVCLWPFLFTKKFKYKKIIFLFFGIIILLTFSRATAIIFVIQLVLFLYLKTKNKFYFLLKTTSILFSLSFIIFVFNPMGLATRFLTVGSLVEGNDGSYDNSTAERLDVFFAGIKMFKDYPWFGIGYGNFQHFSSFYMDFSPRAVVAHNTYITILAELGIIGFLIFIAIIYFIFKIVKKTKDSGLLISFLGYVFSIYFLVAQAFPTAIIFLSLFVCSQHLKTVTPK